ncbi:MAG: response regulator transcription factor [Chloroflexi bacterium]|nr:response regulator transcription factor [Chloroflexota bacterium]
MAHKILIVDDDRDLLMLLRSSLQRVGFSILTAETGQEGLRQFYNERPDLILLDIALPGVDGWKVCGRVREVSEVPILVLTARSETGDRIRGLDLGADDYLTKPFELRELIARIRAVLRRANPQLSQDKIAVFDDGELHVDFESHDVFVRDRRVHLTRREFRLLAFLVQNSGRVLTHQQLLGQVWGPEFVDEVGYVKLYIRYLRTKLEEDPSRPRLILTERGTGYRFARK